MSSLSKLAISIVVSAAMAGAATPVSATAVRPDGTGGHHPAAMHWDGYGGGRGARPDGGFGQWPRALRDGRSGRRPAVTRPDNGGSMRPAARRAVRPDNGGGHHPAAMNWNGYGSREARPDGGGGQRPKVLPDRWSAQRPAVTRPEHGGGLHPEARRAVRPDGGGGMRP